MNVVAQCPGPNCGFQHPINVAVLARVVECDPTWWERLIGRTERVVRSERTGRLCRCPMCQQLFTVVPGKVQRCGGPPLEAPVQPKDVKPERPPLGFPALPEDMLRGYNAREPR